MTQGRRPGDARADALRWRFASVFGDCPVPVPVVSIAEDLLGLSVSTADLPVSGLLIVAHRQIWIERSDTDERRRFTVAHEIAHWVCHRHGDPAVCHLEAGAAPATGHEREANVFAADLLMPADAVRDAVASGGDAEAMAARFDVSPEAMGWRLYNLGLGDRPTPLAPA